MLITIIKATINIPHTKQHFLAQQKEMLDLVGQAFPHLLFLALQHGRCRSSKNCPFVSFKQKCWEPPLFP